MATYQMVGGRLTVQIEDLLGTDPAGGWVYQAPGEGNPGAEGAHYYYRSQTEDGSHNVAPQTGRFSFTFEVATAGEYSILLRAARDTNEPGDARNDVWIKVDDDTQAVMPPGTGALTPGGDGFVKFKGGLGLNWRNANQFSTPVEDDVNPKSTVLLSAGTHTITFAPRSTGVHVDSVSVISTSAPPPPPPSPEILSGTPRADLIVGFDGNEQLNGLAGDDTLDGGAGADLMRGGPGDDTFHLDTPGDRAVERPGEGIDTIVSAFSMALDPEFENLTLTHGAIEANGNAANNRLIGNALGNVLTGGSGNDILDGRIGADTMAGGEGDDTYYVDDALDRIFEPADPGIDTVFSSVSFALDATVENLNLTGTAARGIGNAADNRLVGNAVANALFGGAGNDTLSGGGGADLMAGGAGNDGYVIDDPLDRVFEAPGAGIDTVLTSVDYALGAGIDNAAALGAGAVRLVGNGLDNLLTGNAGNNVLSGGLGSDSMIGGLGDDTYVVDSPTDRILERAGEGTDQVLSRVTHALGDDIETLALTGTAATAGIGNGLDNLLRGNTAANALSGGDGDDVLIGGLGNDRLNGGLGSDLLAGGAGADMFSFTSVADSPATAFRDTIDDFTPGLDRINLSSLDANPLVHGDQAFTFLGAGAFRGLAGDLRFAGGIVEADLDGDGVADLSIAVRGITTLDAADFFL